MINLTSDIRMEFEQLGIRFQSVLNDKQEELEAIIKRVIDNFDFETLLEVHIEEKIKEGLKRAFDGIDISDQLKIKIGNEIEKRINGE